jgi:hypothetical protein
MPSRVQNVWLSWSSLWALQYNSLQHLVAEQDQSSMHPLIWQLKYPFSPVSLIVTFELKEKKSSKSSSFSTKKVSSKQNIISYRQNRMLEIWSQYFVSLYAVHWSVQGNTGT